MDPYEIEFIGENRVVSVIPNFTHDKIYLICGEFGPFRAGLPVNIPLWLAVMLKQKQKCRVVPPDWMDLEILETIKEEEKRSRFFTKMPNDHYMVEAKLILGVASEDIPNAPEIKTLIKDIWDIRMSKLRTSIDTLMKSGGNYGRLDHLTMMEINSVKPLLPSAMDDLLRIQTKNPTDGATFEFHFYAMIFPIIEKKSFLFFMECIISSEIKHRDPTSTYWLKDLLRKQFIMCNKDYVQNN